jgi:hypothetical protein
VFRRLVALLGENTASHTASDHGLDEFANSTAQAGFYRAEISCRKD